jgi:FkbM family methyltransferase
MNGERMQPLSNLLKRAKKIVVEYTQHSQASISYRYKDFEIKLPKNHLLATYQKAHPKYDRFLPKLAKCATSEETIIDIGANIGDSLAGMIESNPSTNYICIEPDDFFFQQLTENIKSIELSVPNARITTIKALVGEMISNVSLKGKNGTKNAVLDDNGKIKSMPLDKLVPTRSKIRILKSDVDGFDYDVLNSSILTIERHKPIIFFECQYDFDYQKQGYLKLIKLLESKGYCDWTVFDNFGEVVIRTGDSLILEQLMDYVWQQTTGKSTRTIYYYDILAIQKKETPLIDKILGEYK